MAVAEETLLQQLIRVEPQLKPPGRYLAQVVDDRSRHEATGFSAWKALAKAYLRWRGLS